MDSPDASRTVLIVNPNAGRLTERTRTEVVDVLRSRLDLEAFSTAGRDTGIAIAGEAAASGAATVIAFGGDGHVNEVVNGLAGTKCALAIVPGGTMNVFARALGMPQDPMAAVERVIGALERPARPVNLGKVNDRFFTFSSGCGFDAEAAERVERYVPAKRRFGEVFFYWSAFRVLTGSYREHGSTMRARGPFGEIRLAMAIASNAGPYAYLFERPIEIAPRARLAGGLDVFGLTSMRLRTLPVYAWRCLVSRDLINHRDVFYASDLDDFVVTSDEPFGLHVDGEPLPPVRSARFEIARDALLVRS